MVISCRTSSTESHLLWPLDSFESYAHYHNLIPYRFYINLTHANTYIYSPFNFATIHGCKSCNRVCEPIGTPLNCTAICAIFPFHGLISHLIWYTWTAVPTLSTTARTEQRTSCPGPNAQTMALPQPFILDIRSPIHYIMSPLEVTYKFILFCQWSSFHPLMQHPHLSASCSSILFLPFPCLVWCASWHHQLFLNRLRDSVPRYKAGTICLPAQLSRVHLFALDWEKVA